MPTDAGVPMLVAPDWMEAHCVIPDGDLRGEPFLLGDEQLRFVANHYRVRQTAQVGQLASAFRYRRSQLVRSQKWGKSPLICAFCCIEGVGPTVFDGFAEGGELYDCRTFGCGCGWTYEYEPGEPMGRLRSTPLIQITATSEDQTDNTYGALRPMIELGPLSEVIPHTGEEFIRLPGDGRIDVVTSKGNSRLGQRVTFVIQDETGLWVKSNGGHNLAKKQRQGLAGMGGRAVETTNAWNPADDSTAQRTFESKVDDVNRDFRQAPDDLDFKKKSHRRKIFAFNYAGAPWVDIADIEAEAAEMMEHDPADAERFFGNRIVAGSGSWLPAGAWKKRAAEREVPDGTAIVLGFDGSEVDDWTGIRAETLDGHQFTPRYHRGERPTIWDPREWGGRVPKLEVLAAFDELFERYRVVRAYCDPPYWQTEIGILESKYPKRVFQWETRRIAQMHHALERMKTDVTNPASTFTHDADTTVGIHVGNAVEVARTGQHYLIFKASDNQKIDLAMSSVLAHEALGDAIANGDAVPQPSYGVYFG
jgi:hypothetical protein